MGWVGSPGRAARDRTAGRLRRPHLRSEGHRPSGGHRGRARGHRRPGWPLHLFGV